MAQFGESVAEDGRFIQGSLQVRKQFIFPQLETIPTIQYFRVLSRGLACFYVGSMLVQSLRSIPMWVWNSFQVLCLKKNDALGPQELLDAAMHQLKQEQMMDKNCTNVLEDSNLRTKATGQKRFIRLLKTQVSAIGLISVELEAA